MHVRARPDQMPELYTLDVMRRYHRAARFDENPPHLFGASTVHRSFLLCMRHTPPLRVVGAEFGANRALQPSRPAPSRR